MGSARPAYCAARLTRYGYDAYAYARLAAGSMDLVAESGAEAARLQCADSAWCGPPGGVIGNWRGERGDFQRKARCWRRRRGKSFDEAVEALRI